MTSGEISLGLYVVVCVNYVEYSGIELVRKCRSIGESQDAPVYGLTTPLLTTSNGAKMGKSVGGNNTIWLDE